MKIVAKCLSLQPLSSEFKDNLCIPIPLNMSMAPASLITGSAMV